MPYDLTSKMVVAVASRALFRLEDAHKVFERKGEQAYRKHQLRRLGEAAAPGVAFPLVQKLLRFNEGDESRVEVIVLSRNDPISGLRVFHSAKEHGLKDVTRGAFTKGRPPYSYLRALRAVLFLSANPTDVQGALKAQCPAATVYTRPPDLADEHPDELRIAFDGDAVLFGDESEAIHQSHGLSAFLETEEKNARIPLPPGPFKPFIQQLHDLQKNPPSGAAIGIRTALVTARNAPAHERVLRTLMHWKIEVDEAFFLGGVEKKEFLEAFQPDFFFDDQRAHCGPASKVVCTGHVDGGIVNEASEDRFSISLSNGSVLAAGRA